MAAAILLALATGLLANPLTTAADPSYDDQESQFLTLINQYRESNGAGDLSPQDNLDAAADWFATDMATKNYYGGDQYCYDNFHETAHCDSLGRLPGERLGDFGYASNYAGENIAAGFGTAQAVFDAWKGSTGHNRNMLDKNYKAIGIGLACQSGTQYGCYWVTDFGANAGPNGPTPTPVGTGPTPTHGPTATPGPTGTPHPTTSGVPTDSPTDTPTPAPTESPPPAPTATPVHWWGDFNCDGSITGADVIDVLLDGNSVSAAGTGCPAISDLVVVNDEPRIWGDTDCSWDVTTLDGIELLEYMGGITPTSADPTCPAVGSPF